MKLPDADRAVVDDAKVRDYLLSPEHPIGRFKARVFAAVGYRRDNWQRLKADLLALAATIDATPTAANEHGRRWVGSGELGGPTGALLPVVTVWLIPSEDAAPRLITVYPTDPL